MSDPVPGPPAPSRGEQPFYPAGSVNTPPVASAPLPPFPDGPAPRYTAPYPPYPYDPPQQAGISQNVASGLAYFTVVPAIFFLLLEPYRHNPVIRFHSWQSIFLFIGIAAVRAVENLLAASLSSAAAFALASLFSLLFFIAWLVPTIKAFQGSRYHLPAIGGFAEQAATSPGTL